MIMNYAYFPSMANRWTAKCTSVKLDSPQFPTDQHALQRLFAKTDEVVIYDLFIYSARWNNNN